jgi:hypothetical protein
MDVVSPLVANREPAVLRKPGQRPLHYPPVSAQLFRTLHTLSGYASLDASLLQGLRTLLVIVGFVGVQLLRTLPRAASAGTLDRFYGVQKLLEDRRIMDVGRGEHYCQWDAVSVRNKVALRARFSFIRRILAGFCPPFWPVCSPSPNRHAPSLAARPLRAGRATPDGASPTLQLRATP